jgi:hypothetical protein
MAAERIRKNRVGQPWCLTSQIPAYEGASPGKIDGAINDRSAISKDGQTDPGFFHQLTSQQKWRMLDLAYYLKLRS